MNTIDEILKALDENGEDTNCLWIEDLLKKLKNKVVCYVTTYNPCCDKSLKLNHEAMIGLNSKMARIYLVDKSKLHLVRGDDWDDAPACCNSEAPSEKTCKELEIETIEVELGKGLEI